MATDLKAYYDPALRLALLVHMDLLSAPLYLCTRSLPLTWNGQEWLGTGVLGSVSALEDGGGQMVGMTFALSGVPQDAVALARDEPVRWRRVWVYLATLADESDEVIRCEKVFAGILDAKLLADAQTSTQISITAEHIGQTLKRPNTWRYTHPDQQLLSLRSPQGMRDDSLVDIARQATADVVWPTKEGLAR